MNNKKIKSITIKKDYNFTDCELTSPGLIKLAKNNPDAFEIEYEKETAKYPNGAEVLPLKENVEYFYASLENGISIANESYWNGDGSNLSHLVCQNVFLDKDRCELSTKLENRHFEIVQRVCEINAENNWVADWANENQHKFYCYFKHSAGKIGFESTGGFQSGGEVYFCNEAHKYLSGLSIEDLKAFLLIYS